MNIKEIITKGIINLLGLQVAIYNGEPEANHANECDLPGYRRHRIRTKTWKIQDGKLCNQKTIEFGIPPGSGDHAALLDRSGKILAAKPIAHKGDDEDMCIRPGDFRIHLHAISRHPSSTSPTPTNPTNPTNPTTGG